MDNFTEKKDLKTCTKSYILAINETLNVINGKWKLAIMGTISCGNNRFSTIQNSINAITPRMLSKELKELELNGIIVRKVYNTKPVTIEYVLTESGKRFDKVLEEMIKWGISHRIENIPKNNRESVAIDAL